LITGLAVSLLAACGSSLGQSEFSCKGYPDGVSCLSARKVYELTNSRSRVTQEELEHSQGETGPAIEDVLRPLPSTDAREELAPPIAPGQQAALPADGVLRVWVGPWTSDDGDVAAPNYVYSRIEQDRAAPSGGIERRFTPLTGQAEPIREAGSRPLQDGDVLVTKPTPAVVAKPAPSSLSDSYVEGAANNVRLAEIYFESGRADVSTSGKRRLEQAVEKLPELEPKAILLAGFTDRVGSAKANQRLAQRRTDAVAKILLELGVETEIIEAAKGEIMPKEGAADGAADPHSRKVWVVALDIQAPAGKVAEPIQASSPSASSPADPDVAHVETAPNRLPLRRDPDDHGDRSHKDREGGMGHH